MKLSRSGHASGKKLLEHDDLKLQLLGVSAESLHEHGAVSADVAHEMATGVRDWLGADYGVSSTGITAPEGGTPDKPIGTVHVAVAGTDFGGDGFVDHRRLTLSGGERERVRVLTSQWALEMLRRRLLRESSLE